MAKTKMLTTYNLNDQDAVEAAFYAKKFFFSYSSINMLLWSPTAFYGKYVMKLAEEDKLFAHLINGKVIHCLLLDNKSFDKTFVVSPDAIPTGNVRKLLDTTFNAYFDVIYDEENPWVNLDDFEQEILDELKKMNLHQALTDAKKTAKEPDAKTGDQKRLDKIMIDENKLYWEFLIKRGRGKKEIIDQATLTYCQSCCDIIKYAPNVMNLLGMDATEFDNVEVMNEELMTTELSAYEWGLKGFLDNVKVDHDARTIFVNDLKTTAKELGNFTESLEFYRYWLQAGVYIILAMSKFRALIHSGYKIKFHFIVIDKNLQVYPFPVSEASLSLWAKKTKEIFEKVNYHYTQKRFDLPYEFDLGLVAL